MLDPVWPLRLAAYFLIGACINALAVLMHEAAHGNFFRRKRLDRWAGFLLVVPIGMSATAYRVMHLIHLGVG